MSICSFAFSQLENTEDDNLPTDSSEGVKVLREIFNEIDRKQSDLFLDSELAETKTLPKMKISRIANSINQMKW